MSVTGNMVLRYLANNLKVISLLFAKRSLVCKTSLFHVLSLFFYAK